MSLDRRRRVAWAVLGVQIGMLAALLPTGVACGAGPVSSVRPGASAVPSTAPLRITRVRPAGGDETQAIQTALDLGRGVVVLEDIGRPWASGPLFIRRDGVSLLLAPGAQLVGLLGAFDEPSDSLIRVHQASDVVIEGGPGSVIRMRNGEDPAYLDGEWRHAISLWGASDVAIRGLTIADSGGDGVFVNGTWAEGAAHEPVRSVLIEDCTFVDHRRQGVSVISVVGLTIRDCVFRDIGATSGTDPMAGIDFEPDYPWHDLQACLVERCDFIDNRGSLYSSGIHSYLGNLDATTNPVDITIRDCFITSRATDGAAMWLQGPDDDGPSTVFNVSDVRIENTRGIGVYIMSSAATTSVTLRNVELLDTHTDDAAWGGAAIYLEGQREGVAEYGNIVFDGVRIRDDRARPFLKAYEDRSHIGLPPSRCVGLSGTVQIDNPNPEGLFFDLDLDNDLSVTLDVIGAKGE